MADEATQTVPQTPKRKVQSSTGSPIGTKKTPIKKTPQVSKPDVPEPTSDVESTSNVSESVESAKGTATKATGKAKGLTKKAPIPEPEEVEAPEVGEEEPGEEEEPLEEVTGHEDEEGEEPEEGEEGEEHEEAEEPEEAEEHEELEEPEAGEALGGVKDKAVNGVKGAKGLPEEKEVNGVHDVEEAAGEKAEEAKEAVPTGEEAEEATDAVGEKAEEAKEAAPTGEVEDATDAVGEKAEEAKEAAPTEEAKEPTDALAEKGEEAKEAAPTGDEEALATGTVDEAGKVVDEEGKQVGTITEGEKPPAGSVVDQDGDVLDDEGNVIAKAKPLEGAGEALEKTKTDVEKVAQDVDVEKPALLEGPFKFEKGGEIKDASGNVVGTLEEGKGEKIDEKDVKGIDSEGNLLDKDGKAIAKVELAKESLKKLEELKDVEKPTLEGPFEIDKKGQIKDAEGNVVGTLDKEQRGTIKGKEIQGIDAEGNLLDKEGKTLGQAELAKESMKKLEELADTEKPKLEGPFKIDKKGQIKDAEGNVVGTLDEEERGNVKEKDIKSIDAEGNLLDKDGKTLGQAELAKEATEKLDELKDAGEAGLAEGEVPQAELPDFSILKGKKVNKAGNIVDENGNPFGKLIEGDPKKLAGKTVDAEGKIWNDAGKVIGQAEPIPEKDREPASTSPFEDFPDVTVDKSGKIFYDGKQIGILTEGDPKKLAGKKVDEDGDVLDKHGNVVGKAIRQDEEEPEEEAPEAIDYSILANKKVNKAGNVVGDNGTPVGRIVHGDMKLLIGKTVDAEGKIYNSVGKVIGRAEPIPDEEREEGPSDSPFEDFPGALVQKSGMVVYEGKVVGKVTEGDAKKLAGKHVDADGDIVDKHGNVLGKCERYEEEEEVAQEIDNSALAGKRVNKMGNVVDSSGTIYGKLTQGDPKKLAGRMCDKMGNVRNEGGDIVGKAEVVPESEREGSKDSPFADFPGATVAKEGKVVDSKGEVVGKLTDGDAKKLYGKEVDEDGDVLDKNGNVLGKAVRWEEEEAQKDVNPMSGRKVNKEGNIVDENGDVIGKLVDGDLSHCAGKKVDDDGDVVDQKGKVVGHVSLLGDIKAPEVEPEPQESAEDKEKREQLEEDKKLASRMAMCIESSLDKIKPVLKMITERIEKAERTPKEELDEQKLVDDVKPLLEEGGRILQEANGVIRGLDPDGRIQANAKHKTASREATPEEYRLADLLKELTGNVTETIDNAKKKIADMPHAEKELNPLWGLLAEPLFQILAAVGLLLSGVLGLVGKLLNGLGLGGLVNNLLGGLGITKVLDGLGLGKILAPITGGGKKKK